MEVRTMKSDDFVSMLGSERALAILRAADAAHAEPAMEAAVRAGFRILEFTLNTPGALDRIADFSHRENLVVGAGTVLDAGEAREALRAGARFLVSPVLDRSVIGVALEAGVAVVPGVQSPTEMLQAHRAGAPLQKLFPAPGSGPAWVRACLGPLPFLRLVPTNDVDAGTAAAWLSAGAFAVGFGNRLFAGEDLAQGRYDRIEERARRMLEALRAR
jgi:Entner-Doudoroff aldolase